jgi:hypothetical protein
VERGPKLYVQPAELARKLVKEMEDHKVSRASRVSVRNRYTVFLCEEDFDRLNHNRDPLIDKLERHLAKHVRSKRYEAPGDICVDIVLDADLRLGHFGILGEREAPGFLEQDLPARFAQDASEEGQWQVAAASGPVMSGRPAPARSRLGASAQTQPLGRLAEEAERLRPIAAAMPAASSKAAQSRAAGPDLGGSTRIIAPADAAELGLARNTIVIKSGTRVHEFTQGRVILGRARDADFCIDNVDVSRRHAAIYWSNGKVMIEDLGSTNGTMVNGYPVSSTVLTPEDVVVIGDCRMNVDTR